MLSVTIISTVLSFIALRSAIVTAHHVHTSSLNNRPIVGVLTQEISYRLNEAYPNEYHSYLAASYVKFLEGAGARVVPIWIGKQQSYYEDIIRKINGVLWPGGSTYFNQSNGYADAGNHIYNIAKRINRKGDYFPILGICLGFELLTYLAAQRVEHRINCNSYNQRIPLELVPNYRNSRLFGDVSSDIVDILTEDNVTANFHTYCVTKKSLRDASIHNQFRVLSLNNDLNGVRFISSLEHVSFPFYGLQFHPEKNLYEWIVDRKIPHGNHPTQAARYFAEFFVNEARKNSHEFASTEEEALSLIYNYPVTYTGLKGSAFEQSYLFKKSDTSTFSVIRDMQKSSSLFKG